MMAIIEYVWIGGEGELRSKTRVIDVKTTNNLDNIPKWNYDGSSTNQADGEDSEIVLTPRRVFWCPLRDNYGEDMIVLCDTSYPNGDSHPTNNRTWAKSVFDNRLVKDEHSWFGLEQEFFLVDKKTEKPIGFVESDKQGEHYCNAGKSMKIERDIVETHLRYCLKAGISISGVNAEVAPGQWEFQIGPCEGIDAGDELWMARYLMERVVELYDVSVNWGPKPLEGKWNGSGCHTNFSTKQIREGCEKKCGLDYIYEAIEKLSKKHVEHMTVYGKDNELRMTGEYETASYNVFTWGVADRGASIRIGNDNFKNKKGYFEDRRPGSNCDPYLVTAKLCETIILEK
ncbi:MAG: glutamine synthetase [Candidatus Marinimicrobia bacterium]|nr:glutamine synthetase [Candidatus Neomarinimicrobiota bacterium]